MILPPLDLTPVDTKISGTKTPATDYSTRKKHHKNITYQRNPIGNQICQTRCQTILIRPITAITNTGELERRRSTGNEINRNL